DFCCSGCRFVYTLLHRENLGRYYELRGARGVPVADVRPERADRKWLEAIVADVAAAGEPRRVAVDIQGIHCAACVWLIAELFRPEAGGVDILATPALGRIELTVRPAFALRAFVDRVESFGYRLGPPVKREPRGDALLARMGVCVALAMNTMIF